MATLEEYKTQIKAIDDKANNDKLALAKEFAYEHALYKVGDIIKSNYEIIKVELIKWGRDRWGRGEPYVSYVGTKLKKDFTPFKSGEKASIMDFDVTQKL